MLCFDTEAVLQISQWANSQVMCQILHCNIRKKLWIKTFQSIKDKLLPHKKHYLVADVEAAILNTVYPADLYRIVDSSFGSSNYRWLLLASRPKQLVTLMCSCDCFLDITLQNFKQLFVVFLSVLINENFETHWIVLKGVPCITIGIMARWLLLTSVVLVARLFCRIAGKQTYFYPIVFNLLCSQ